MEYTIEFGTALVIILIAAMVFWGIYWKNEIKDVINQREKLKDCGKLGPIQFSTVRKTDVITIKSLQHHAESNKQLVSIRQAAARRQ